MSTPTTINVPIEPTEIMVIHGFEAVSEFKDTERAREMSGCEESAEAARICWRAMLNAAPAQAVQEPALLNPFTELLLGVINDTQNALGFADEEKACANGSLEIVAAIRELRDNARRYEYLRSRDLDTIHKGGVFAGKTPDNLVLNEEDLDKAIDDVMEPQS